MLVFKNKNLFLLWQGVLVSRMGTQFVFLSMTLWITFERESPGELALLNFLPLFASIILGPIFAPLIDWIDHKKLIIFSDLISGVVCLIGALAISSSETTTSTALYWVYFIRFLLASTNSFFQPAMMSLMGKLVHKKQTVEANSFFSGTYQSIGIIGELLAALLFHHLGLVILLIINGCAFLISAFTESYIKTHKRNTKKQTKRNLDPTKYLEDLLMGFKQVFKNSFLIKFLCLSVLINIFVGPLSVILPFFVKINYQGDSSTVGYILFAFSAATLLSSFSTYLFKSMVEPKNLYKLILIIAFACFGIYASSTIYSTGAFLAIIGFAQVPLNIALMAHVQSQIAAEFQGRVFSLVFTLFGISTAIAMFIAGGFIKYYPTQLPNWFLASAIACVFSALLTYLFFAAPIVKFSQLSGERK